MYILLTSTALVAFAGAAAADVSFSGTAEFSYNDSTAFSSTVSVTAAGSQALNNGYTASASLTAEVTDDGLATAGEGPFTAGDISIANDSSSITFHVVGDGVGAANLGDVVGGSAGLAGIFEDPDTVGEDATITGSATVAGATISASLHDGNAYEIGVSTDLGGTTAALGYADGNFGAKLSGAASSVDYTLAFASNDTYGIEVSTTAGGADLSMSMSEGNNWEVGVSMPLGAATVSAAIMDGNEWDLGLSTTMDAVTLGFDLHEGNVWELSAGYAAGDVSVDFATDESNEWSIDATYDLGNGITAGAGTDFDSANYVEVDYDLGGGANLSLDYATAADINPAEEIAAGTTLSVSFSF